MEFNFDKPMFQFYCPDCGEKRDGLLDDPSYSWACPKCGRGHYACKEVTSMDILRNDAFTAWEKHVQMHLKMNGPGCDIARDEKCKHWFIIGYISRAVTP